MSPWVEAGVCHTIFDHTSLLRYVSDKWGLGDLGARTATANSIGPELTKLEVPRDDTPSALPLASIPTVTPNASKHPNDHQKALISFSHLLEEELRKVDGLVPVGERALRILEGMEAQFEVAKDRFLKFIHYKSGSD
jgi:phospholipase C